MIRKNARKINSGGGRENRETENVIRLPVKLVKRASTGPVPK